MANKKYSGELTQVNLNRLFTYDPVTGEIRHAFTKTHNAKKGDLTGCPNSVSGYLYVSIKGRQKRAHRVAWIMSNGPIPDGLHIDHINGDRADNRLVNLRLVTNHDNHKNVKMMSNNKSGVTGVYRDSSRRKWVAEIRINRKTVHLGRFDDVLSAKAARAKAERKYGFHPNHGRAA